MDVDDRSEETEGVFSKSCRLFGELDDNKLEFASATSWICEYFLARLESFDVKDVDNRCCFGIGKVIGGGKILEFDFELEAKSSLFTLSSLIESCFRSSSPGGCNSKCDKPLGMADLFKWPLLLNLSSSSSLSSSDLSK